jgi:pyroglutamyl-peptidase
VTILVTGFEPYQGMPANASELVVRALGAAGRADVVTDVLPTAYRRAGARIEQLLERHRPSAVVLLGLASSATALRLERVALNLDDEDATDNDGDRRSGVRIVDEGPVGYWSSLPIAAMTAALQSSGETVELSHDAGGYVCNHVFFRAIHHCSQHLPLTMCGLVHVPYVTGPGPQLDRLVAAVSVVIDLLRQPVR